MNEKLLWVSGWLKGAYHMSELAAGQNSPVVEIVNSTNNQDYPARSKQR